MADIRVNLVIDQKGNAGKQMADLGKSTKTTANETDNLNKRMSQTMREAEQMERKYQTSLQERIRLIEKANQAANRGTRDHHSGGGSGRPSSGTPEGKKEEKEKSAWKQASGYMTSFVALAQKAEAGMTIVARGVGELEDQTLTAAQRTRRFAESLPVLGGVARAGREMIEAMNGTTNRMNANRLRFEYHSQRIPISYANQERLRQLQLEDADYTGRHQVTSSQFYDDRQNRYLTARDVAALDPSDPTHRFLRQNQLTGSSASLGSVPARTAWSAQEDRNIAHYERLLPIREQGLHLERDIAFRRERAFRLGAESNRIQRPLAGMRQQADVLHQQFEDIAGYRANPADIASWRTGGSENRGFFSSERREDKARILQQLQNNQIEQSKVMEQLEQAKRREIENQNALLHQQQALRQNEIAISRERLSMLNQERERSIAGLETFGDMSAAEKISAVQAAEQARDRGYGTLSQDQRALMYRSGIFSEMARDMSRRDAMADPLAMHAQAIAGRRNPTDVDRDRVVLQNQVNAQVVMDEAKLAADIAQRLGPLVRDIIVHVERLGQNQIQQVRTQFDINAANR